MPKHAKPTLLGVILVGLSVAVIGCTPAAPQRPAPQATPPTPPPTGSLPPSGGNADAAVKTPGGTMPKGGLKSDADIDAALNQLGNDGSNVDEPAASDDDLDNF